MLYLAEGDGLVVVISSDRHQRKSLLVNPGVRNLVNSKSSRQRASLVRDEVHAVVDVVLGERTQVATLDLARTNSVKNHHQRISSRKKLQCAERGY